MAHSHHNPDVDLRHQKQPPSPLDLPEMDADADPAVALQQLSTEELRLRGRAVPLVGVEEMDRDGLIENLVHYYDTTVRNNLRTS